MESENNFHVFWGRLKVMQKPLYLRRLRVLNVADNTDGLRYDKVILATEADVDGILI